MIQEGCVFEWHNIIAAAAREGFAGEDELQWSSYKILSEQLQREWLESIEKRKTMPRPKGSKRAPKSPEQRRKISEAISAKWADPVISNFSSAKYIYIYFYKIVVTLSQFLYKIVDTLLHITIVQAISISHK